MSYPAKTSKKKSFLLPVKIFIKFGMWKSSWEQLATGEALWFVVILRISARSGNHRFSFPL